MGVNAPIEGSNPSFSAHRRLRRRVRFTGETRFPPCAPFLRASGSPSVAVPRGGRSLGRPAGGDPTSPASRPWELRPRYPRILASLGRASLDRGTIVRKVRLTLESDGRKLEERDKRREKRWGTGHPSGFDERSPYGHLRAPGTGLRRWTGSGR